MTKDQKEIFLHRINETWKKLRYAHECKDKWDEFHLHMEHDMYNIVAYARNVGSELLYNEILKQEAIQEALTSSLDYMGYRLIYDNNGKAIDIKPLKESNK